MDIKVGDIIVLNKFGFRNPHGGTGLSNWKYDEVYDWVAKVIVTKVWFDYETGVRGWAEPINSSLKEYLKRNAKQTVHSVVTSNDEIYIPPNTVFFSEFDIV